MDYIKICCSECINDFKIETNATYSSEIGRVYFDGFESVERLFAHKICENLEKFIDPWWKQDSLRLIKSSFVFNHKTKIRAYNENFNKEFIKVVCRNGNGINGVYSAVYEETHYFPRNNKLTFDTKYQYNDRVRFRGSGVLNVLFYFADEDKPESESEKAFSILSHDEISHGEMAELILKTDDIVSF